MSFDLVVAIGFVAILIGILVGGYFLARGSGKKDEKLDQLGKEKDSAAKQVEKRTDPVMSDAEYRDRLRRAQERYARLRRRKTE